MSDTESGEIGTALEMISFEMVPTGAGDKYEVPVSKGPQFKLPRRVRGKRFQTAVKRDGFMFIAAHTDGYYLSSKVLASDTNEFFHVKVTGDTLQVYPKDENFSKKTLESFINAVETHIGQTELVTDE